MNVYGRWYVQLNQQLGKYMTFMTPLALLVGFVWSDFFRQGVIFVPWLFALVMFVMALGCDFQQLQAVFRSPGIFIYVFVAAHIVLPVIAWFGGSILFGGHSPFAIGLLLFAIIPLGVSSIMWVGLAKGQVPLVLGLVIVDSILSPFIVPGAISLFVGEHVRIAMWEMMQDLIYLLVIPTLAGVTWQTLSKGRAKVQIGNRLAPWSKVAFVAVLLINAASIKPYISVLRGNVVTLLVASLSLIIIGYLSGYLLNWISRQQAMTTTLAYALGMRNISLGLVIALQYFNPLVAVPVVIAILLQQPIASIHYAFSKSRRVKGIVR